MCETLFASFQDALASYPQRPALRFKERGAYHTTTYAQLGTVISAVASHLSRLGIVKGDAIGILSGNRPEWVITDLAALHLGAVVVPIYPTSSSATINYIINDARVKILLVENLRLLNAVSKNPDEIPSLGVRIVIDQSGEAADSQFIPFETLCRPVEDAPPSDVAVTPEDVATIVYTSGTTGEPKGVVLTHANILSNVRAMITRYQVGPRDVFLSYLPLCHMFERTCGYYAIIFSGGTIAYAESPSTVNEDVLTIRPTILLAVPRILEKALDRAVQEVSRNRPVKQRLVSLTIVGLNARADLRYERKRVPFVLGLRCLLLDHLIASQFRRIGGGRLRLLASGAAPLDRKVAKLYLVLGFNVVEGYGLTETSPAVCSNSVVDNTLGTVGRPVDGVQVMIGDDEEILVKGPNVMRGYLNKPEETARVIDANGWFHTGDQGRFDFHGNLIITGRIKELIVTSYGKKIAVAAIEQRILRSPHVSQAMAYGDKRQYIVALVVPPRGLIELYARRQGIQSDSYPSLLKDERIRALIAREIEDATIDLAPFEKVKAFSLIAEEFTIESGLLTPTLKPRRAQIVGKYIDLIEAMYRTVQRGAS